MKPAGRLNPSHVPIAAGWGNHRIIKVGAPLKDVNLLNTGALGTNLPTLYSRTVFSRILVLTKVGQVVSFGRGLHAYIGHPNLEDLG